MDEEAKQRIRQPKPSGRRGVVAYLRRRHGPLTSLVLTVPVFLVYHLGILAIDLRNGVDIVSKVTFRLLDYSTLAYAGVTLGVAVGIGGAAWWMRRKDRFHPREIVPVLVESTVLALAMSVVVGWATRTLFSAQIGGRDLDAFEKLVMAAGAGFHEELVFRVVLFAGGAWLLQRLAKLRRLEALLAAGVVTSLAFSAVHYVGALGDEFQLSSFTFRALAGGFFALIYAWRGFAVAVYTHTLYDVYVFFVYG
ncbi:MAG: type II CAAX prenyl endopeptidase Rce1 family protein [Polyangiales bacterium]